MAGCSFLAAAGRRFLSVWQAQYPEPLEGVAARGVAAGRRPACRRSYIGVCRGGVCVTDLCRRCYIGVCKGGVCVTDLRRLCYIGVCRGGVCVTDLCRRCYIGVCRGGIYV